MLPQILFWLALFLIFHSYVIYPLVLYVFSLKRKNNQQVYETHDKLPFVSILIAAYNEENVIAKKIQSIYHNSYPPEKYEILVGSDASTDKTNSILQEIQAQKSNFRFFPFAQRQGKGNIINRLMHKAQGEIIIFTDANVMLGKKTLFNLLRHFRNPDIGLADTRMINHGKSPEGISIQESAYISREVLMKNREGKIFGTMMGPFGGCYAIRKELYTPVPPNFMVDDFFINMKIFQQGKKAINDLEAKVFEDVSNDLGVEFRRKVRIATGNFQNLAFFRHFLFPFSGKNKKSQNAISPFGLFFTFFSHKVLRWLGPFLLLTALFSGIFLLHNTFYRILWLAYVLSFLLPFIDFLLRKIKIHIIILRFITHFYTMNLALFIGFFKFLKGVKSNVWQPTKRNQTKKKQR